MAKVTSWKRGNKFNNVKQTYNGHNYDSKLEAEHAYNLDLLIDMGVVNTWNRQVKISLDLNGIHICNYFIDFEVFFNDGRKEYHEVKGAETDLWRFKWRFAKALYQDYNFVLLKQAQVKSYVKLR